MQKKNEFKLKAGTTQKAPEKKKCCWYVVVIAEQSLFFLWRMFVLQMTFKMLPCIVFLTTALVIAFVASFLCLLSLLLEPFFSLSMKIKCWTLFDLIFESKSRRKSHKLPLFGLCYHMCIFSWSLHLSFIKFIL